MEMQRSVSRPAHRLPQPAQLSADARNTHPTTAHPAVIETNVLHVGFDADDSFTSSARASSSNTSAPNRPPSRHGISKAAPLDDALSTGLAKLELIEPLELPPQAALQSPLPPPPRRIRPIAELLRAKSKFQTDLLGEISEEQSGADCNAALSRVRELQDMKLDNLHAKFSANETISVSLEKRTAWLRQIALMARFKNAKDPQLFEEMLAAERKMVFAEKQKIKNPRKSSESQG